MINDREGRDDEADAQAGMRVIEVTQPNVDSEARWVKKSGKSVLGYKQHTVVDDNGLVIAVETTAANCHDSKPLLTLLDKAIKNKPLTRRQLQRNNLITKARYIVEQTFGSQTRWIGSKVLHYCGNASAHAWHILQAMAYNLRRLPKLYVDKQMQVQSWG